MMPLGNTQPKICLKIAAKNIYKIVDSPIPQIKPFLKIDLYMYQCIVDRFMHVSMRIPV